ncbi:uncharacterized protein ACHE_61023A [Aspergillus chevalieri]|uniref:Dimethylallyl tryptophan synthase n=1 Tax=Aspergillus chevalieri TaxID=182096 RepID=A0A7R7VUN4_ASPCH|nr:uncharacterized protein ACHE_61023A [Aspergillus chevalieri]BCR91137.1 hypothetical protein ACHE_61023A [Aspergillus chevalieri]
MQPFHTLSRILPFPDATQKAWWDKLAPMLLKAMQAQGYDTEAQYAQLGMVYKCVLPYLGQYPTVENDATRWKSFLCPYGIPIEPSLNISQGILRYAFEPIGPDVGTDKDPQNMNVIQDCLKGLTDHDDRIDTTLYAQFASRLLLTEEESQRAAATGQFTFKPGQGMHGYAVDMKGSQPMVKGYFCVGIKSAVTGIPTGKLMLDAVREVDTEGRITEPLDKLEDYYGNALGNLRLCFMSVDMIDPQDARTKLYGLQQEVSFEGLEDLWTLGGRINTPTNQEGLQLLRELWDLLQIPPGVRDIDVDHCSVGQPPKYLLPSLVNWTFLPGHSDPMPQVYVVPFGLPDAHISDALVTFFERRGWTDLARNYKSNLASYFPDVDFSQSRHVQEAISFSFRKGKPYLSVYMSLF